MCFINKSMHLGSDILFKHRKIYNKKDGLNHGKPVHSLYFLGGGRKMDTGNVIALI